MLGILLIQSNIYASTFTTLYDLDTKKNISSGLKYKSIKKLTNNGWMNINILEVNLKDKYTYTAPIYNKNGVSIRQNLSTMMQTHNAIAGINGDFFIMQNPTQSFGAIINNNEVITSPYPKSYNYPTLSLLKNGNIDISVWDPNVVISNYYGKSINSTLLNKGLSIKYSPVILNKYYGKKTPGNTIGNSVEIVVKNNIITQIRDNKKPVNIPENGYVICCASNQKSNIKNTFKVGQTLKLKFQYDLSLDKINWSLGGVNYLVRDGEFNQVNNTVLGRHPRTTVGFNKDNSKMYFITIDGRNKNYIGAKQSELAQICINLGIYNAINLDGGGSTTMGVDFLKNGNIEIVNFPSDGVERPIASGLGIFSNAPNNKLIDHIEIKPANNCIFKNSTVKLNTIAYNNDLAEVEISKDKVKYYVDNSKAFILGNKLVPKTKGKITVKAVYKDYISTCDIDVLDTPITINFNQDEIITDTKTNIKIRDLIGVDKNGRSAYISADTVKFQYRNAVGKINKSTFTSSSSSRLGYIIAKFDNAVATLKVKVGYKANTIFSFNALDNINFSTYPNNSNGNISVSDNVCIDSGNSIKLCYDFTNMTDQSIFFVNFGKNDEGLEIEGKPKALGLWVLGDNKKHWLRTRVLDANNKIYKLNFAEQVDWNGWKYVTAKLPKDIQYPIKIKNIYLAEINESLKDKGTIYIDKLRALYEVKTNNNHVVKSSKFKDIMKSEKVDDYICMCNINNNNISYDNKTNNIKDKPIFINLKINAGSFNYNDMNLWEKINSISNYENKNIIISLNKNLSYIEDNREIEILNHIFKLSINKNNTIFVINKDNSSSLKMENGIRYITYKDKFKFYITNKGCYYNN